jgi:septal ring factor EnvC (AmiA/AmiB activator)
MIPLELLSSSAFEAGLLELLLGLILTFNIGAYSFLWYKIRRVEEDVDAQNELVMKLYKRIFGIEEDETYEGHLVETQEQFDRMQDRFDKIEDKIDLMEKQNREDHSQVSAMLQQLVATLDDEDINVNAEDFDEYR